MAINLNDNIKVVAPKPTDARYLDNMTPYSGTTHVINSIPIAQRYIGLTVNVGNEIDGYREYWFKNNIDDLVPKDPTEIDIDTSGLITGATNLGYFIGRDGLQRLNVGSAVEGNMFPGFYDSTYFSYYLDGDGYVRMGSIPWGRDGVERRAYIRNESVGYPNRTSIIWNTSTNNNKKVGWILVNLNIEDFIDENVSLDTFTYYNITQNPIITEFVENQTYLSDSNLLFISVTGNLTGGNPLQLGSPIFSDVKNNVIGLKSLHGIGDLKITNDNYRIFLDVNVPVTGATSVGGGVSLLTSTINNKNIQLKTIVAGDNIEIDTQTNPNQIIIHSVSGGTGGGGSGGIKKEIVKNGSWNEELVELEFPEESIGVRITYSIKNNTNYSMGDIYFTKNNDSEIFISSMFDDIENLVFIKEMNEIDLKIENSASDSSNDNIKINLLINYI